MPVPACQLAADYEREHGGRGAELSSPLSLYLSIMLPTLCA